MMEKFGIVYQFSNDIINITLIWVWFSNKVLTIKKMKIGLTLIEINVICEVPMYFKNTNKGKFKQKKTL